MRKDTGTPPQFTLAQRRHMEVSLGHILSEIDEALVWFHRWPLPGPRQDRALKDLEALAVRIRDVTQRLGLSPSGLRPDPLQKLEALASEWWSTALDCRSEVLRGYGEVDPSTGPLLDPLMEGLAAALLNVGRSSPG